MNRYFLLVSLCFVPVITSAHEEACNQWSYASLSFTNTAKVNKNILESVSTFVLWEAPHENGIWQDNARLTGSIKTTLTKHFGLNNVHASGILNKIGSDGWEAYGFHTIQVSDTDQTRQWQLKKCVK